MNEPNDTLVDELKGKLVKTLGLPMSPAEIDPDAPMLGAGLGIDSIDALEIVVLVEKDYGVRIENRVEGAEAFASVRTLADFIRKRRGQAPT
jgi:acyl carrier protein